MSEQIENDGIIDTNELRKQYNAAEALLPDEWELRQISRMLARMLYQIIYRDRQIAALKKKLEEKDHE